MRAIIPPIRYGQPSCLGVAGMTVELHQQDRRQFERQRLRELSSKLPPLTDRELADLRTLWWRQAALGYRLPAQPDLIVLDGGRP